MTEDHETRADPNDPLTLLFRRTFHRPGPDGERLEAQILRELFGVDGQRERLPNGSGS